MDRASKTHASTVDILNDLTDAFARGRVTAAELAAISPEELDAFFEIGAQRLDANRNEDALTIFGGLVSLYPYAAKYWRAYGIALQRRLLLKRALAAYRASLVLEPHHLDTLCYTGEAHLYLGEFGPARSFLTRVVQGSNDFLKRRAEKLLSVLNALLTEMPENTLVLNPPISPPQPEEPFEPKEDESTQTFVMSDGRKLPLNPSRYEATARTPSQPKAYDPEDTITHTAALYIPEVAALSDPIDAFDETGQYHRDFTLDDTLHIDMKVPNEKTATAIIPGRPKDRARKRTHPQEPQTLDDVTAVVRRRRLLPLMSLDFEATELPLNYHSPQAPIEQISSGHRYDKQGERCILSGESEFDPHE